MAKLKIFSRGIIIMTIPQQLNQTFEKIDYSKQKLIKQEFESCKFVNCNFSNCDLSQTALIDCKFENCNLSMIKILGTGLRNVKFINCKIMGVDFSNCAEFDFAVSFEKSCLDYAFFIKNNLKKTKFEDCIIKEANFTKSDLTDAEFNNCDLSGTIFTQSNLGGVDFTTAKCFSINPDNNSVKKAKFSIYGVVGLLDKYDIIILN